MTSARSTGAPARSCGAASSVPASSATRHGWYAGNRGGSDSLLRAAVYLTGAGWFFALAVGHRLPGEVLGAGRRPERRRQPRPPPGAAGLGEPARRRAAGPPAPGRRRRSPRCRRRAGARRSPAAGAEGFEVVGRLPAGPARRRCRGWASDVPVAAGLGHLARRRGDGRARTPSCCCPAPTSTPPRSAAPPGSWRRAAPGCWSAPRCTGWPSSRTRLAAVAPSACPMVHVRHARLARARPAWSRRCGNGCAATLALLVLSPLAAGPDGRGAPRLARPRPLPPDPGRPARPPLLDAEAAHDDRRRRGPAHGPGRSTTRWTATCSRSAATRGSPGSAGSCGAPRSTSSRSCSTSCAATCPWSARARRCRPRSAPTSTTYARRLLVKPGLTGLWQVSGRSDLPWEESVRLDLRYVDNWSLRGDLAILARTFGAVVRQRGLRGARWDRRDQDRSAAREQHLDRVRGVVTADPAAEGLHRGPRPARGAARAGGRGRARPAPPRRRAPRGGRPPGPRSRCARRRCRAARPPRAPGRGRARPVPGCRSASGRPRPTARQRPVPRGQPVRPALRQLGGQVDAAGISAPGDQGAAARAAATSSPATASIAVDRGPAARVGGGAGVGGHVVALARGPRARDAARSAACAARARRARRSRRSAAQPVLELAGAGEQRLRDRPGLRDPGAGQVEVEAAAAQRPAAATASWRNGAESARAIA